VVWRRGEATVIRRQAVRVNGWDGDPTHPPPPQMLADGPAPAYAVIHTSHHISPSTPLSAKCPSPRGYIYFSECSHERSFCV
jgi:hypothetical protein